MKATFLFCMLFFIANLQAPKDVTAHQLNRVEKETKN